MASTKAKKTEPAAASESEKQIVFDPSGDRTTVAGQAIADPVILVALVENLAGGARRMRQFCAAALNIIAHGKPEVLVPYIAPLVDALKQQEAQTRWECLEALSLVAVLDPKAAGAALPGAEISLYDEESGPAHLAAIRFLCAYGAIDAERSEAVWPLIDEGIQCYHGDLEFHDMLDAITVFASGTISPEVRAALQARMDFDAKNGKGTLGRKARAIVDACAAK